MFSRQEHHTDDQVICWNCEEAVHQSTIICPYCNVEIHRHQVQKALDKEKITQLPQSQFSNQPKHREPSESAAIGQTLSFLCALALLLSGSALFFLAVIIALFARDGAFTLSWPEHSWSAFFGLGLFLLSMGMLCMQKLSGTSDDF